MDERKALAVHNTDVTEGEWDGPGAVANMANDADTLRYCHAWIDPDGDPEAKSTYKFPHHRTKGGPAVLNGVRNALARLPQANIPEGDKAGVERHLRAHLDKQEENSMADDIERRSYHLIEVRAGEPGEAPKIEGIAAVYDQPTEIETFGGSFVEVIEPGFFEGALGNDVRALWNHNTDIVLGRTKSGTLRLMDKQEGLGVEIAPPDTQAGRDAVTSIRRGDVDQMSFAFSVRTGGDEWKEKNGKMVRTLKRGACKQLYDVSPVTFPAYPQTSVAVRSVLQDHQLAAEASRDGGAGQEPQAEAEQAKAQERRRRESRARKLEIEMRK